MSTEQLNQFLQITQKNILKNPFKDNDQNNLALSPSYTRGIIDTTRIELHLNNVVRDTSEETINKNGYLQVYVEGLQDKIAGNFFGLNGDQDSFLFRALGDTKEAVDSKLHYSLVKQESIIYNIELALSQQDNPEESSLKQDLLMAKEAKEKVWEMLTNWSQLHQGEYNKKNEINLIQNEGKNKKFQCKMTQKNAMTKNDLYSVSCIVEIDEKNRKVICSEIKKRWSPEAGVYLGIDQLEHNYTDEISYSLEDATALNLESQNDIKQFIDTEFSKNCYPFYESWKEEKSRLIEIVKKFIKDPKLLKKEINHINKRMSRMKLFFEDAAKTAQNEDEIHDAITCSNKTNEDFINGIKNVLIKECICGVNSKVENNEIKNLIENDFNESEVRLKIKSTQPFINKTIEKFNEKATKICADLKEEKNADKWKDAYKKANLNVFLAYRLMEESNIFYKKIETIPRNDLIKTFNTFSDDFDKTVENSGLNIQKGEWEIIFDDVSRSLSKIGLSSVASVVDSISHFIFGRTNYEIAKKVVKTLSDDLKGLPVVRPAVM